MTGPAAARELAARIGILADDLDGCARRFWTLAHTQGAMGRLGTATVLGDFDDAGAKLETLAAQIAALPPGTLGDLGDTPAGLARRLTDAVAVARLGDGLPTRADQTAAAVETIRRIGDALLVAAGPCDPDQPATRCHRVEVTATRCVLSPPCCPNAPILLARDTTEPLALNHLDCLACGLRYDVALLGDPDDDRLCGLLARADTTRPGPVMTADTPAWSLGPGHRRSLILTIFCRAT